MTQIETLSKYRHIIVTGPHRAGTTIASYIIAHDLGYEWYEEPDMMSALDTHDPAKVNFTRFFELKPEHNVVHCPSVCAYVQQVAGVDGIAVVMVKRHIKDIIRSQRRVGWGFEQHQLAHYPGYGPPIALAKYDYWRKVQKPALGKQAYELSYLDLRRHTLWVPPDKRKNFTIAQIEVGQPRGDRVQNAELADVG